MKPLYRAPSLRSTALSGLAALAVGSLLLAAPPAHAAPLVYGESATVKVRPQTPVRPGARVELTAARNEFVSFQVVVNGADAGATGVSAIFEGLEGPGTIGGSDVTLYREALINITESSARDGRGWWPEGLVPDRDEIAGERRRAFPFDVPRGESRAAWVDVHVPSDAPPGQYAGRVDVTGHGLSAAVEVSLTVVDVLMPSTPSLRTAFLVWSPHVCQAHTGTADCGGAERAAPLLARYEQMALEHRVTLSSVFGVQPQGGDWSVFDRLYGPFLDGTAPGRLPGARMTSAQYQGPLSAEGFAAFARHFKEKGWLDRAYVYTADEPPHHGSWEQARQLSTWARQADPALATLLTTSLDRARSQGLEDLIDLLTPVVNQLADTRAGYDAFLRRPGKELWLYQSCMSQGCGYGTEAPENTPSAGWPTYMIDRSAARNRAMQWVDFAEGATGELYYQSVGMLPTAWVDQFRFNGNGDGTLFLPGTPDTIGGTTDVPVAGLRLKLLRLGIQDYEWLKMVSDAGDPGFAQATARALVPAPDRVGDDGHAFDRARLALIDRLLELRPPSVPPAGDTAAPPVTAPQDPAWDPAATTSSAPGASEAMPAATGGCSAALPTGSSLFVLGAAFLARLRRRRGAQRRRP